MLKIWWIHSKCLLSQPCEFRWPLLIHTYCIKHRSDCTRWLVLPMHFNGNKRCLHSTVLPSLSCTHRHGHTHMHVCISKQMQPWFHQQLWKISNLCSSYVQTCASTHAQHKSTTITYEHKRSWIVFSMSFSEPYTRTTKHSSILREGHTTTITTGAHVCDLV